MSTGREGRGGMGERDDGDSPVVLRTALNHKVADSNPTLRGRGINYKSIINHHKSLPLSSKALFRAYLRPYVRPYFGPYFWVHRAEFGAFDNDKSQCSWCHAFGRCIFPGPVGCEVLMSSRPQRERGAAHKGKVIK